MFERNHSELHGLIHDLLMLLAQSWHHTSVMFLFWAFENARMTNHWFLVAANSFVHVFVYGYFALSTLGYTVRWKKYITLLQVRVRLA